MFGIFLTSRENKQLFEIAVNEYEQIRSSEVYTENFKFEIFTDLNNELDRENITVNNIKEIVAKLKEKNPSHGTFVHWSDIDNLEKITESYPDKVQIMFNQLVNGEKKLSERINTFRSEGKQINAQATLGTPLIGYILTAFDQKKYAPYKDGVLTDFVDLFELEKPGNIGEKYEFYLQICQQITDYLLKKEIINEFNMLYGQDLVYLLSEAFQMRFNIFCKYLVNNAIMFNSFRQDLDKFLTEIKKLDKDYLEGLRYKYEDDEKINKVRFIILDRILSEKSINVDEIKRIAEEVNRDYDKNILKNWSEFNILFQLYYDRIKNRIRYIMDEMHKILRERMKQKYPETLIKENDAIKDFSWKQNFGGDSCWLSLYPQGRKTHKDAAQLTLFISGEKIEYGLNLGENLQQRDNSNQPDLETVDTGNIPDLDDILSKYNELFEKYLEINKTDIEPPEQMSEPFSIIFPDSESANKVFEFINDICRKLNISNENDPRYAITYRDYGKTKGIHLNYTNILVFGVYGYVDSREINIQVPLFKDRGIEFGEKGEGTFKSFTGDKEVELFYVPYDLLLNTESELYALYDETLSYIKRQKQNYTKSPYKNSQEDLLARAIFNREERKHIFKQGLDDVNYYWFTSNPREIKFVDKHEGDIIKFQTVNQVGDRAGSRKRIHSDIGKIKKGDRLIAYHTGSGIWALLESGQAVTDGQIEMQITDKLHEPLTKKEIINKIPEELDLYGKTIQQLPPQVYHVVEDIFIEKQKVEENGGIISSEPVKIPSINFNQDLEIVDLYFPPQEKRRLEEQIQINLSQGKHIILTGPPGTGKSKLAKEICKKYVGDRYNMVTATSDWSTFNTIGGYRPDIDGRLNFDEGVFLSCFKKNNKPDNRWLILDEINRADIDKAFGPLFSALTGDKITLSFKSSKGNNITLQPQGDLSEIVPEEHIYIIPEDWRLLATMNTFDKTSLYEMSYAFMRRFAFIPVSIPREINFELVREYLNCWGIDDESYIGQVFQLWNIINEVRKIGPAIIEDLYRYLLAGGDFTSALINFVLPQFEGARRLEINSFISDLKDLNFMFEDDIKVIKEFTGDYFSLGGQTIGS